MEIIDEKLVKRLSWLAKLDLSEQDKSRFGNQLAQILEYVKKVGQVDRTNRSNKADRQALINGLVDNVRVDEERQCLTPEQALKNAPSSDGRYFKVKAIFE